MTVFEYGNPNTGIVLVQPVDDHDMSVMDSEVRYIRELTDQEFGLIAVKVRNWNTDLSPWAAPAAFGNEGFGNGAADTLTEIMKLMKDPCKTYIMLSGRHSHRDAGREAVGQSSYQTVPVMLQRWSGSCWSDYETGRCHYCVSDEASHRSHNIT